jgi:polysaccharide pyruvyl transferase WcaK-like protein
MTINILIFGYYDRQNFGDDIFEYVFKTYIFNDSDKYNVVFKNIDNLDIDTNDYKNIDKVIIGGGDIINEYFFNDDRINKFRKYFLAENTKQVPIYFVGIGLTYESMINVLDIGDFFYMRNNIDYKLACNRFDNNFCKTIPDLAFFLNQEVPFIKSNKNKNDIQKIGICIPSTWLYANVNDDFFNEICNFIQILSKSYKIYLIPFDTSMKIDNSDILLNNKIENQIGSCNGNVFYIKPALNIDNTYQSFSITDMINYFKHLDVIIGSRYHSIILSIITKTPFICIYSTPKLFNLMSEIKLIEPDLENLFIKIELDINDKPTKINPSSIINTLKYVILNYNNIITKINTINNDYYTNLLNIKDHLINLINNTHDNSIFRQSPPQYITRQSKDILIQKTISQVVNVIFGKKQIDYSKLLESGSIMDIIPDYRSRRAQRIDPQIYKKPLTENILWSITGDPYAPYYYGLFNNVLTTNLIPQLEWLIDDYYLNYYYKQVNVCNLTIVNKNFQNIHRSGWQYILNKLIVNLNESVTKPLIIDMFIDKTFHWNCEFYKSKNIIPYLKPWIGVIHHTYSDYNNNYNCSELFQNDLFIKSLETCKCLIVLTHYLEKQIKQSLLTLNINVQVVNIIHASENPELFFDWDSFIQNDNKQIVQVGSWLRDIFSIYRVELPTTSIIKKKCILKNKDSSNYFPPPNFLNDLKIQLNFNKQLDNSITICQNAITNMHIKSLYDNIVDMENSVYTINHLDNYNYDKLLSENIIFLNLIDASAINTLIECIIRNTPIIVNPIPPVVELLGPDYPLYYNNYYEISKKLDDKDILYTGYLYLCNMDKSKFDIDTFISKFTTIILAACN